MTIDSGGSVAIKGFNYQKAVIAYIAILNYEKENFQIIIENQDDVEVFVEKIKTFIQIKSEKLSLKKIVKPNEKTNRSILGKLLNKKHHNAIYKIVTTNKFSENDKKHLEKVAGKLVSCDVFRCSVKQQKIFEDALKNEDIPSDDLINKISRSFIVISPFEDNLDTAVHFLLGVMSDRNISVDGNKGRIALTELFLHIDIKGELNPNKHQKEINKKELTKIDLDNIFVIVDKENSRSDVQKDILEECNLPIKIKANVRREFFNLYTIHRSLRRVIYCKLKQVELNENDIAGQVKELCDKFFVANEDKAVRYAIIIDVLIDKIFGE